MSSERSSREERQKMAELLKDFSHGMLITISEADKSLHSRPMAIIKHQSDSGEPEIWMATSGRSPKIQEITKECKVNVSLQSSNRYMSLSGTAEIIRDRELLRALWTETIRPWFPQGQEDPDLCMIRVIPNVGEYWDYSGIGQRLSFAWEVTKSYLQGEKVKNEAGDHNKVKLQVTS